MTLQLSPEAWTDELLDRAEAAKELWEKTPTWRKLLKRRRENAWLAIVADLQENERQRVRQSILRCISTRCQRENPEPSVRLVGFGLTSSFYVCGHCGERW